MDDLSKRQVKQMQKAIDHLNSRLDELHEENLYIRNQLQTNMNLVSELQRTNTVALAKLHGTGATAV